MMSGHLEALFEPLKTTYQELHTPAPRKYRGCRTFLSSKSLELSGAFLGFHLFSNGE